MEVYKDSNHYYYSLIICWIIIHGSHIVSTLVRLCKISSSFKETPNLTISRWLSWNWKPPSWQTKRVTQLNQIARWGMKKVVPRWFLKMKCNVNTNEERNYHFPLNFTTHSWQSIDNCPLEWISYPLVSKKNLISF